MAFRGAIFDLDGVLVDTVPLHYKAWKKMFSEYGKDFTFEDYKTKVDGIPRIAGARAILKELSQEELEKAASKKQGYFLELLKTEGITVYQSSRRLLEELRSKGIKLAVISSSKNCPYILQKAELDRLLDTTISGGDIPQGRGKPDPWIFLTASEKLGLKNWECIVFEDAVLGVEAAKKAGMKIVGIDRHNDAKRLIEADLIVKDLNEVNFETLRSLMER